MKLLKVDTVNTVKEKLDTCLERVKLETEVINVVEALGRISAVNVISPIQLPEFNRATVDGYAVVAKDTFGASESIPVFLEIVGKVEMGYSTELQLSTGKAVYVPTGGMIPTGSDSMVMIEYVEELDRVTIAVNKSVAPGDGIIFIGDDIKKNDKLILKNDVIRPQEIGVLTSVGIDKIEVLEQPRIAVISTGDEIEDPFSEIKLGQVRDINTYLITAIAQEMGAKITIKKVIKDDFFLLKATIAKLIKHNHIIAISGGSSMGNKDITAIVIDSLGEPGVLVHGVAVKPGKPTIVGLVDNTVFFGLPGHPSSCALIFKVFGGYFIDKLLGNKKRKDYIYATCDVNIASAPGKETYQMVDCRVSADGYIAKPLYAKSAAISHLAKSQGFITIPSNKEGIKKGELVQVELL